MAAKAVDHGPENMRLFEKQILLQTIDGKWREHLLMLEHLRSVVGFRSYAQRDPLNEYKTESFQLFESMLDALRTDVTAKLTHLPWRKEFEERQAEMMEQMRAQQAALAQAQPQVGAAETTGGEGTQAAAAEGFDENDPSTWGNPGRNEQCPCGSGKKFKHCHGRLA